MNVKETSNENNLSWDIPEEEVEKIPEEVEPPKEDNEEEIEEVKEDNQPNKKTAGRFKILVDELKAERAEREALQKRISELENPTKVMDDEDIEDELRELGLEKTHGKILTKGIKALAKKVFDKELSNLSKAQQEAQQQEAEYIEQFNKKINKEFEILQEEGRDRFTVDQLKKHMVKIMQTRAEKFGESFEEQLSPPLEYVYDSLDKAKPKTSNKEKALDLGRGKANADGSIPTEKDILKRGWNFWG
jgi:hypothetical protein